MRVNSIKKLGVWGVLALTIVITGCSTSKERLLPHGDDTMMDVWNRGTGGSSNGNQQAQQLMDARQSLRRPIDSQDQQRLVDNQMSYSRTAQNEI